jgi:hypothetical protein
MSSAYYLMAATREAITHIQESQRFESMYILQEKPITHNMYVATFQTDLSELNRVTAPEKIGSHPNSQHVGRPIRGSPSW